MLQYFRNSYSFLYSVSSLLYHFFLHFRLSFSLSLQMSGSLANFFIIKLPGRYRCVRCNRPASISAPYFAGG